MDRLWMLRGKYNKLPNDFVMWIQRDFFCVQVFFCSSKMTSVFFSTIKNVVHGDDVVSVCRCFCPYFGLFSVWVNVWYVNGICAWIKLWICFIWYAKIWHGNEDSNKFCMGREDYHISRNRYDNNFYCDGMHVYFSFINCWRFMYNIHTLIFFQYNFRVLKYFGKLYVRPRFETPFIFHCCHFTKTYQKWCVFVRGFAHSLSCTHKKQYCQISVCL